MSEEPTPGVLLTGEDGTKYFIPNTDLEQFAVDELPTEVVEDVAANQPRLDAFVAHHTDAPAPWPSGWLGGGHTRA